MKSDTRDLEGNPDPDASAYMPELTAKLVAEIKLQIEYHRFEIDDLYAQWRMIEEKEVKRRKKLQLLRNLQSWIRAGRMPVSLLPNDEPD